MNPTVEGRVPLTVLGGFLGSGKTTWLRHQLHHGKMTDALVIVNEAAHVPVDDVMLFKSSDIRVLAGACACCDGREELKAILRQFCNERVDSRFDGTRHQHILLETSGLADPGAIVDAIRNDPVLMHHILVREIIVAVDALHGISYLSSEPLGRRQVEIADRLVVTKADVANVDDLRLLRATLETLNPGAALSACEMGSDTTLPETGDVEAAKLPKLNDEDVRPVVATSLKLAEGSDWTAFGLWLSALLHARGDELVRVKGIVRTPSGRLLLQSVRKVVQSPEILPDQLTRGQDDNCIVFIGKGFSPRDLRTSLKRFAGLSVSEYKAPDATRYL